MREFGQRVWWEWIKSHTDRKGWFRRHNKCDNVAGEVALHEDRKQARFVEWDWDYVLVNHEGARVEGDVRQAVRRRVAELFWEASRGGHSEQRWESDSPTAALGKRVPTTSRPACSFGRIAALAGTDGAFPG